MKTIRLCRGIGQEGISHCVMAATSIVAGENFTDEPECVDPVITSVLIKINDSCPSDEIREELLSHLPWMIIGTRSDNPNDAVKRAEMLYKYCQNKYGLDSAQTEHIVKKLKSYIGSYNVKKDHPDNLVTHPHLLKVIDQRRSIPFYRLLARIDSLARHAGSYSICNCPINQELENTENPIEELQNKWLEFAKDLVRFVEEELIPVYTTMAIEPAYNIDKLVCK